MDQRSGKGQNAEQVERAASGEGERGSVEAHAPPAGEGQSMAMGVVGGLIGAVLGVAIWGAVTALTGLQLDPLAIVVGVLVGLLVRVLGKGAKPDFGTVAVLFTAMGILAGNLLMLAILAAQKSTATFG